MSIPSIEERIQASRLFLGEHIPEMPKTRLSDAFIVAMDRIVEQHGHTQEALYMLLPLADLYADMRKVVSDERSDAMDIAWDTAKEATEASLAKQHTFSRYLWETLAKLPELPHAHSPAGLIAFGIILAFVLWFFDLNPSPTDA